MAENNKQSDTASTKAAPSTAIAVRLVENAPVTQPMLVNYCTATVTSGLVIKERGQVLPFASLPSNPPTWPVHYASSSAAR